MQYFTKPRTLLSLILKSCNTFWYLLKSALLPSKSPKIPLSSPHHLTCSYEPLSVYLNWSVEPLQKTKSLKRETMKPPSNLLPPKTSVNSFTIKHFGKNRWPKELSFMPNEHHYIFTCPLNLSMLFVQDFMTSRAIKLFWSNQLDDL